MSNPPVPGQGTFKRLLWFALPLLLLAVVAALQPGAVPRGSVAARRPPASPPQQVTIGIPPDLGAPRAKVLFEVFLPRTSACECHAESAELGQTIGALDPSHVRVRFHDLALKETIARLHAIGAPAPCLGFAVNGKYRFPRAQVTGDRRGGRTADFLAAARDWTVDDVYAALAHEYRTAYRESWSLTREQFVSRVSAELQRRRRLRHPGEALARR